MDAGSSRRRVPVRVRKKGWTLAQLLRGGEQQATRVQPKPLDLERNGSIYRAYRMQLREEAAAFATSSVLTHPR
jgi:hypothetical protein